MKAIFGHDDQFRITSETQALTFVLRYSLLDIRYSVTWITAQQTQNQSIQVCITPAQWYLLCIEMSGKALAQPFGLGNCTHENEKDQRSGHLIDRQ